MSTFCCLNSIRSNEETSNLAPDWTKLPQNPLRLNLCTEREHFPFTYFLIVQFYILFQIRAKTLQKFTKSWSKSMAKKHYPIKAFLVVFGMAANVWKKKCILDGRILCTHQKQLRKFPEFVTRIAYCLFMYSPMNWNSQGDGYLNFGTRLIWFQQDLMMSIPWRKQRVHVKDLSELGI